MRRAALICLCLLTSPLRAADAPVEERVHFAKGASSATVSGQITGADFIDFVLGARGGQQMKVHFHADNAGADFNVLPPGSDMTALDLDSPGEPEWTGRLPYDGDYRVRVFLYRGARDNGVTARFELDLSITGLPDPDAPPAPVFGPAKWDARGLMPCGADSAMFGGPSCPFKVLRYDSGATFWIQRDEGDSRILYVEGEHFSTDSAATITAVKEVDTWTVRVGDSETYLIPEVAIIGDTPY